MASKHGNGGGVAASSAKIEESWRIMAQPAAGGRHQGGVKNESIISVAKRRMKAISSMA